MYKEEFTLEKCLQDIESYLDEDCRKRNEFLAELKAIPNVEYIFHSLVKKNKSWRNLAEKVKPRFLLEIQKGLINQKRTISLCIFDSGTIPVIKVVVEESICKSNNGH